MEYLDQLFFSIGYKDFTYLNIVIAVSTIIVTLGIYFFVVKRVLPRFFGDTEEQEQSRLRVVNIIRVITFLIILIGLLLSLELDSALYEKGQITIKITTLLQAILIIQFARLLDWIFSKFLIYNYERTHTELTQKDQISQKTSNERKVTKLVTSAIYTLAIILILQYLDDVILYDTSSFQLRLSGLFEVVFIILVSQVLAWVITQVVLFGYFRKREIDLGGQYAINQIVKYIIYVLAFFIAAQALGLKMTVLLGGLAALLVGVGLGLQQTFNDLFSGIILLFERSVEIGQTVEVDGLVGNVKQIGLRTSIVETQDNITVIVPNSKLITEKVVNWSHYDNKVRFHISVGVAYGSDTELVKKVLLGVVKDNVYVLDFPEPMVRFTDFGDSALSFELHFWSRNFIIIEDIKSDLRFAIDKVFREQKIEVPFPQRDVWLKKE